MLTTQHSYQGKEELEVPQKSLPRRTAWASSLTQIFKIKIDNKRIYGLDILRASAILFVVFGHAAHLLPQTAEHLLRYFTFDGVSIFFVLSGFLIGGILINTLEIRRPTISVLFRFWSRRWIRTIPAYFLVLVILVLLNFTFAKHRGHPYFFTLMDLRYIVFSQNWYTPHPLFFQEAWSLCVEEWFYLLIPIMLFILTGWFGITPKRTVFSIAIVVISAVTIFRYLRFLHYPLITDLQWDLIFRKQVVTRLDSSMFGVIGAWAVYYYRDFCAARKKGLLWIGLILLGFQQVLSSMGVSRTPFYSCVFSFAVTSVGAVLLLPYLSDYNVKDGWFFKPLTLVSLISYSMYLLNLSVIQDYGGTFIRMRVSGSYYIQYLLFWVMTLMASALMYKYFEKPVMDLRKKL
jgi:peptidoglycan/LPS O-acetylase OafA/YrhL